MRTHPGYFMLVIIFCRIRFDSSAFDSFLSRTSRRFAQFHTRTPHRYLKRVHGLILSFPPICRRKPPMTAKHFAHLRTNFLICTVTSELDDGGISFNEETLEISVAEGSVGLVLVSWPAFFCLFPRSFSTSP